MAFITLRRMRMPEHAVILNLDLSFDTEREAAMAAYGSEIAGHFRDELWVLQQGPPRQVATPRTLETLARRAFRERYERII